MFYDVYISHPLLREFNWLIYLPFFSDLVIFGWICATLTAFSIIIDPDPDDEKGKKRKQKQRDEAMYKFYYVTGALIAALGFSAVLRSPEVFFKLVKEIYVIHDVVFSNIGEYVDGGVSLDFDAINYDKLEIYSIKELCNILDALGDGTIPKNNSHYHKVFMQIIKLKGSSFS